MVRSDAQVDALLAAGGDVSGELRRQVAAERALRRAAEREAQRAVTVRSAIHVVARERDALTSPALDAARKRIDDLAARAAEAVSGADRVRDLVNSAASKGFDLLADPVAGPRLSAALAAEAAARSASREQLAAAGLSRWVSLPEPAVNAAVTPEDQVGDFWPEIAEVRAARDAAAAREERGAGDGAR